MLDRCNHCSSDTQGNWCWSIGIKLDSWEGWLLTNHDELNTCQKFSNKNFPNEQHFVDSSFGIQEVANKYCEILSAFLVALVVEAAATLTPINKILKEWLFYNLFFNIFCIDLFETFNNFVNYTFLVSFINHIFAISSLQWVFSMIWL